MVEKNKTAAQFIAGPGLKWKETVGRNLVKRRTVLAFASWALSLLSFLSGPARCSEQTVQGSTDPDFYIKNDSLRCGSVVVNAISACVSTERFSDLPFCYAQELSFVDKQNATAKSVLYEHPMRQGEPQFVSKVACIAKSKEIVVMSSNFANCATCEWYDVYDLKGRYEGTIGDPGRDLPFKYKQFSPEGSILTEAARSPAVDISRNP